MDMLIKAAVLGTVGTLAALLVKKTNPELAFVMAIGVAAVILGAAMELIRGLEGILELAAELTGLSSAVLLPVFKCVGIGIITRLAADLCKDAGQSSVASSVELMGTASALLAAMPLMRTLLQMIGGLL